MTQPTKLQRHLDIIAYLVGRRLPVSVEELMEGIPAYAEKWNIGNNTDRESVRRMFERDKDDLRAAGIPLKTIKYNIDYGATETEGYIVEKRDFYLPYLKLVSGQPKPPSQHRAPARVGELEIKQEDAPVALEALRRVMDVPGFPLKREAKSAFRKLAFDLDPEAFSDASPVLVFDTTEGQLTNNLKKLSDALLARKRVSFHYRGMYRGQDTEREVNGYALLFQSGHWYLIGHDATRNDIRVFRAGRMSDVVPNTRKPNTADYSIPRDFSVAAYVGRQAWELGDDEEAIEAKVRFRFPLTLWAERNGFGEVVEQHNDGSQIRVFVIQQVLPFARWLLSLQTDVEVIEPDELRAEVEQMARKVGAAHGATGE
jgi:proteasome accessory factor B